MKNVNKKPSCGGSDKMSGSSSQLPHYIMPGLELLREEAAKDNNGANVSIEELEENKEFITKTLNLYGIAVNQINVTVGPTVTLYEIIPGEGARIVKFKRIENDLAMSRTTSSIRVIAPIPGKGTIGIEIPNKNRQMVTMRSIIGSRTFQECQYGLPMAIGSTINNEVFIADLAKIPHLLVAGATGQGKSVCLNAIITSLLYKKHPGELKFVLIDTKMVEFNHYRKLERHYLAKLPNEDEAIINDPQKAMDALNSLCVEMDKRFDLLRDAAVRSLKDYNTIFIDKRLNPEKGHRYLPYIVVVIDEFADMIMTLGKEFVDPIARIAQKGRAIGIHLIIATQRLSTDVITGIIKNNFFGHIAFRVANKEESKTIIDCSGAEKLIGQGDMLFSHNGQLDRIQCAFIDTPEVETICQYITNQPGYKSAYYMRVSVAQRATSLHAGLRRLL